METKIILKNVNKFYGTKQALKNVNLTITEGMFGLLGKNGAGKTTLMKVLATLHSQTGGTVEICGIPITESKKIRSMIGYLPQDFSMYGSMSAYDAMDYLGVLSGLTKKERKERIPYLLEQVNLLNNRKTKVKAMSGGMRRRLGIAQAILHNPKVLIVDEPTAGLDPEERVRFRNLLSEIAKDRIVLLSTHIVGDIEATCEQIAVMDEGEIIYHGTVANLLMQARGKIYSSEISRMELEELKKTFVVTGMLTMGNKVTVRYVVPENNPSNPSNAILVEPNVEDAYMWLMNQARGEKV